jgi:hypothetical protein
MSEHSVVRQEPLKINRFTAETVEHGGVTFINSPNSVVASWEPPPGFDPQAHAQQHNLSNISYETHTDSVTGETRSIAYTEMSHEEYEELRQSPQGRVLELPPMPAEKVGNTLGMITFKPSVSPTRAALANPPEIPPEDVENPEAPEGERTSEKLKQLTAEREALNKKLINSDAADEYVRFDELHGSLNDLIEEIKGEPGTLVDYVAQADRAVIGFVKDALVGVGEAAYEGSKMIFDVQQAMLTPAGIKGQILDAQILLENIRLGNVTTGTMSNGAVNTATSVGKAIVAPVNEPWAKGQYVESVTRAGAEILSLPLTALKASKLTKAGEVADALSDANKATQALETAQDTTTAVKSAETIAKTDEVAKAANANDATKAPESKGPPEGGTGGKIKQKIKSLRRQYLGKTPGKKSKTGREVQDRMRAEGKLREDPITGRTEFQDSKGNWHDIAEADMSHHPKDAVTWWNETGHKYGARSPEVRKWMLDSDNYTLDHYSLNRSAGAKLTETYRPPL